MAEASNPPERLSDAISILQQRMDMLSWRVPHATGTLSPSHTARRTDSPSRSSSRGPTKSPAPQRTRVPSVGKRAIIEASAFEKQSKSQAQVKRSASVTKEKQILILKAAEAMAGGKAGTKDSKEGKDIKTSKDNLGYRDVSALVSELDLKLGVSDRIAKERGEVIEKLKMENGELVMKLASQAKWIESAQQALSEAEKAMADAVVVTQERDRLRADLQVVKDARAEVDVLRMKFDAMEKYAHELEKQLKPAPTNVPINLRHISSRPSPKKESTGASSSPGTSAHVSFSDTATMVTLSADTPDRLVSSRSVSAEKESVPINYELPSERTQHIATDPSYHSASELLSHNVAVTSTGDTSPIAAHTPTTATSVSEDDFVKKEAVSISEKLIREKKEELKQAAKQMMQEKHRQLSSGSLTSATSTVSAGAATDEQRERIQRLVEAKQKEKEAVKERIRNKRASQGALSESPVPSPTTVETRTVLPRASSTDGPTIEQLLDQVGQSVSSATTSPTQTVVKEPLQVNTTNVDVSVTMAPSMSGQSSPHLIENDQGQILDRPAMREMLQAGHTFRMYRAGQPPVACRVHVHEMKQDIIATDKDGFFLENIKVNEMKRVIYSTGTPAFQEAMKGPSPPRADCCFAILSDSKIMSLECESSQECYSWKRAFAWLKNTPPTPAPPQGHMMFSPAYSETSETF